MAKILVSLEDWIKYLESRVGIDLYLWGGNGELFVNVLSKIVEKEKSDHTEKEALNNIDRLLTLLQKRLLQQVDIYKIRCEDCSGLGVKFLMDHAILKYDTNCNGLYDKTKAHKVSIADVKAGDYLFMGNDDNKWHIGYAISNKYAIECQNHDLGVVQTKISDRSWKYATRPDWYEGVTPEPVKPVLTRELYLKEPYMKGDDIKEAQKLLNSKNYNCGTVDGIFGKKCDIATKNFQSDNNLTVDGVIGKNTAEKLGFKWEG